jgi:hypothetical protein
MAFSAEGSRAIGWQRKIQGRCEDWRRAGLVILSSGNVGKRTSPGIFMDDDSPWLFFF